MSAVSVERGIPLVQWVAQPWTDDARVEVAGGAFVVTRIGGNPHHYLASRLARQFEDQWSGCRATAPGLWVIDATVSGDVVVGRFPDVLVDGDDLITAPAYVGRPLAVVEVWSPSNTLAEMNQKRVEYLRGGAAVMLEAQVLDGGMIRLEWFVNAGDHWRAEHAAEGPDELVVASPRAFSIVPNALLS